MNRRLISYILVASLSGTGFYLFLFFLPLLFGNNPLLEDSFLQIFPGTLLLSGGGIAVFHFRTHGGTKFLEKTIFAFGMIIISSLSYALILAVILDNNKGLVEEYFEAGLKALEENPDTYINYSNEKSYQDALEKQRMPSAKVVVLNDFIIKNVAGAFFNILFLLLFFTLPNYFRRPKLQENGKT